MARRYTALGRSWRRKEAADEVLPPPPPSNPPPPLPLAPQGPWRAKKPTNYRLQTDFKFLEREKKVSAVLDNSTFRQELEGILQGQLEGKNRPAPLTRPSPDQWLSDQRPQRPGITDQQVGVAVGGGERVIPINDLRGAALAKYTVAQRETRCKLAAVYRLADMFGWNKITHTHITACYPGEDAGYLVDAMGLLYREVTASNLVCVDLEGRVLDPGSTQLGVDRAGWVLHSLIHGARRDVKCVVHVSSTSTVAVSAMNCGLLRISVDAIAVGGAAYFNFLETEREELEDEIASVLGESKVLILRNHGAVAMGASVEEAFCIAHRLVKACDVQVAAMPAGLSNLTRAPGEEEGVWGKCGGKVEAREQAGVTWRPGELRFEALMRMLDSKGYQTGYTYKGLDLLQPGTSKNKDQSEARASEKMAKHKKLTPEAGEKIAVPKTKGATSEQPSLPQEPQKPDVPPQTSTPGDGLQSLQATAEQVARSTGDAFRKLEDRKDDLSSLAKMAERVAESTKHSLQQLERGQEDGTPHASLDAKLSTTPAPALALALASSPGPQGSARPEDDAGPPQGGDAEDINLLELTKRTAERVARSTGNAAAAKLSTNRATEDLGPLEQVQVRARHVAESTGDAVRKLAQETRGGDQRKVKYVSPLTSADESAPSPSSPSPVSRVQRVNGMEPTSLSDGSGIQHYQLLHSTPVHLPITPTLTVNDDTTRVLPPLPTPLPMLSFTATPLNVPGDGSVRMLPPIPDMKLEQASLRPLVKGQSPNRLGGQSPSRPGNGYLSQNFVLQVHDVRKPVPRSLDSDSEYSTTESVDLSQTISLPQATHVCTPPHVDARWLPRQHLDLETNPSKNMVHTAQMVAESTGKAMHKLTTTLPSVTTT